MSSTQEPTPTVERLRQDLAEIKTRTSTDPEPTRPKICTVMRVKNEEEYIHRAISSLLPLGGEIVVLDDGSTDATPDIIHGFSGVHYHRQDDLPMDEGRDRSYLLREALKLEPEWIFTLDGDEELPPPSCTRMLKAMDEAPPDITVFRLHFVVMWGADEYFTQSKFIWPQDRMFRVSAMQPGNYNFHSPFERNLHCGCVPANKYFGLRPYNRVIINAFIKYWGYESVEACKKKLEFYEEYDGTHHSNTKRLIRERLGKPTVKWRDDLSAHEIGKLGVISTWEVVKDAGNKRECE